LRSPVSIARRRGWATVRCMCLVGALAKRLVGVGGVRTQPVRNEFLKLGHRRLLRRGPRGVPGGQVRALR